MDNLLAVSCDEFEAEHPEVVAHCKAAGIDWQSLIATFGPILKLIIAQLLQKWITPVPTPVPTPAGPVA